MFRRTTLSLALLLGVLLAACNTATPGVTAVEIVGGDRALEPGEHTVLSAVVTAASGIETDVTWSIDDPGVATLAADGTLVAQDVGTAIVTATSVADTTVSDSVNVTVALDPSTPQTAQGTYIPGDHPTPALGVVLQFQGFATELGPVSFTDVGGGTYFGPLAPIDADGAVDLVLPDPTDMPADLMGTAATFLPTLATFEGCTLTASDPDVGVTFTAFSLVAVPGAYVVAVDGPRLALLTDAPPPEEPSLEDILLAGHPTWVYAEEAVAVEAIGAGCTVDIDVIVDLELEAGWNQLTWQLGVEGPEESLAVTSLTLRHSTGEPVYVVEL